MNHFLYIEGLLIKISTANFRPPKLHNCPSVLEALMYRSWHSDPNERPTLSFIKRVLLLASNILVRAEATYTENITPTNVEQNENIWIEQERPSAAESNVNNENVANQDSSQNTNDMTDTEQVN